MEHITSARSALLEHVRLEFSTSITLHFQFMDATLELKTTHIPEDRQPPSYPSTVKPIAVVPDC